MSITKSKFLEIFHWVYLIVAAISVVAAVLFDVDKEIIEIILILSVWGFDNQKYDASGCKMEPRPNNPISSILCASYNAYPKDAASTISICVFTGSGKVLVSQAGQDLLKQKAKDFYEHSHARIHSGKLVPLRVRRSSLRMKIRSHYYLFTGFGG